jgi:hypothetical protein
VTEGQEPRPAAGGDPAEATDDHEAVVARLREELDAARRRVRDAWAQYQRQVMDDRTREAIAASPLVAALLALVQ